MPPLPAPARVVWPNGDDDEIDDDTPKKVDLVAVIAAGKWR